MRKSALLKLILIVFWIHSCNVNDAPELLKFWLYKLTKDICLHSKRAHEEQNEVVFSFLKSYRNLSLILILLTQSSYLLLPSIIMTEIPFPISEFFGVSIDCFHDENLKPTV